MTIKEIIMPREKDLGGFSVRRILPYAKQNMVGPWIFFDHMGPAEFPAGEGINVRPHPHINLATVTYLFEGEILHRDSLGNQQSICPGDINLMVAGSGIAHSERERDEIRVAAHKLHGLQLWHALPENHEEIEPAFYHYPSADIPVVEIDGVAVRVLIGCAYDVISPVITFIETVYIEAHLQPGQSLELPKTRESAVYVIEGGVAIDGVLLEQYHMMTMEHCDGMTISATQEARVVLIGGASLGERYIYWNFVSSRKERIEQAKLDWREGRFAKVSGDEVEFMPLPDETA
jgi:redox-sensitive bicupin YhaK (pirin superfamily)